MKLGSLHRHIKFAIFSALLVVGIALAYFRSRGTFSSVIGAFLAFAYAALTIVAVKAIGVTSGDNLESPVLGVRLNWKNIAKALVCLIATFAWIPIALSFVSDTTAGMFVLLTPPAILGTAALFFISRSY
jgi:hypothetical protein